MKPIDQLSDDEWQALVQRAIAMPDAPPHVVRRALEIWRRQAPAPQPVQPLLRRWVAVLSFDSWAAAPVAAGMRALPSEVRQMLFSAQGRDIDLRVAPQNEGFALSGQLLGPFAEGQVDVASAGSQGERAAPRHSVPFDALGEFRIDGVPRGTYLITVRLGSEEIELPPIDVGPLRARGR